MTKVSIIIPTYNRACFLPQVIESALNQPEIDLEVIVVDDGSIDETAQILKKFNDSRLQNIFQENQGKGAAINRGFAASKGEYIGKLDSDDWYLLNALQYLVKELQKDPKLGVAAGGYQIVDQEGALLEEVHPWVSRPDLDMRTWIKGCPVLWQGALVRREWFEKVGGFNQQIRGPDDWDFGIRLALAGCRMKWVKELIFNYRLHPGNSIKNVESFNQESIAILDHYFSLPELPQVAIDEKKHSYQQAFLNCAAREYAAKQFDPAKRSFSKAIELDPKLLSHDGEKLFFTIAWWARSPLITREPINFVSEVIANLPDEAARFRKSQRKALAEMYAVLFYQARENGNWKEVRRLGVQIIQNDPARLLDRGVLSTSVRAILWRD